MHGCFWHQHQNCPAAKLPASNQDYWSSKLERNRKRFKAVQDQLRQQGWKVLVIWECETKDQHHLRERIKSFMKDGGNG